MQQTTAIVSPLYKYIKNKQKKNLAANNNYFWKEFIQLVL